MTDLYPPKLDQGLMNFAEYEREYQRSIEDPEGFWAERARDLDWMQFPTKIKDTNFDKNALSIKWFKDGVLNLTVNCIDRHLATCADQTAIIWEGDDPDQQAYISYQELHDQVCRFANVLKVHGIGKGDRVSIYMPMIPEAAYAMLACARIGAVHSVVFGGFSPAALAGRIRDCDSCAVITADEGVRGNKRIALKKNVDTALLDCPNVKTVFCVRYLEADIDWIADRDVDYAEAVAAQPAIYAPEAMNAEDPLFILYTSGSTGKPKGVLHTTGGYLLYGMTTFKHVFGYQNGDVHWCTADVGWITGHTYVVYAPLASGATTIMFEGVPSYPDAGRFWQVCDKHQVTIFFTAPTALRSLMREGNSWVMQHSRQSIRVLASVGEPINPKVWKWFYDVVGERRCPIVDTWWQTETGGAMIAPQVGVHTLKPGSATRPMFGVKPLLVDDNAQELHGAAEGNLCIAESWPGQMRTVYGDHQRFADTYFAAFDGLYFTGDGARRDADGDYWITGRVDDLINVSGHLLGTAEIESALVLHQDVAEAAVVGYPHDVKGNGLYAYVTLMQGSEPSLELEMALRALVREEVGPVAAVDLIQWTPALPKTRSGKIMRRILRKIAANDYAELGDTSTLADPSIVDDLISVRVG
ncbi:MAG: acetate--CoA ligase [Alphaproteobacteria bacterium]|nr:acetate--CoA ligase [Alphaproteobacteria bacterium]